MPFEPMLATSRVSRPLAGEWVLEPKFDGWRAIVAVDQGVRVWTRTGHELTERLPELAVLVDYCGGASVVSGNEPFLPTGTHSLSLPSGSVALSPVTCIGPKNIAIRMFGADAGGTDSGLRVRVLWYGLLNQLLGATDFAVFKPGSGWWPTSSVNSTGGFNLLIPLVGSTSARVQLTPLGGGSSNWHIDDLYVDPWLTS